MFEPNHKVCDVPRLVQRCQDWIFRNLNCTEQSGKISVYYQEMLHWGSGEAILALIFLLITAGQILDGCLTLKKSHTSCWLKLPNSIWSVHTRTEEISTKPGDLWHFSVISNVFGCFFGFFYKAVTLRAPGYSDLCLHEHVTVAVLQCQTSTKIGHSDSAHSRTTMKCHREQNWKGEITVKPTERQRVTRAVPQGATLCLFFGGISSPKSRVHHSSQFVGQMATLICFWGHFWADIVF